MARCPELPCPPPRSPLSRRLELPCPPPDPPTVAPPPPMLMGATPRSRSRHRILPLVLLLSHMFLRLRRRGAWRVDGAGGECGGPAMEEGSATAGGVVGRGRGARQAGRWRECDGPVPAEGSAAGATTGSAVGRRRGARQADDEEHDGLAAAEGGAVGVAVGAWWADNEERDRLMTRSAACRRRRRGA
jgi:hypothetical protein